MNRVVVFEVIGASPAETRDRQPEIMRAPRRHDLPGSTITCRFGDHARLRDRAALLTFEISDCHRSADPGSVSSSGCIVLINTTLLSDGCNGRSWICTLFARPLLDRSRDRRYPSAPLTSAENGGAAVVIVLSSIRAKKQALNWRVTAVCGVLILSMTFVWTGRADADEFGTYAGSAGPLADNYTHTYCYGPGLNTGLYNNVDGRMSNLDVQTLFTDSYGSCNGTNTDVVFLDADLPSGVFGQYVCVDRVDGDSSKCDQSEVTFDPDYINGYGTQDDQQASKTACHEIGHSVGTGHGTTDCTISGYYPSLITYGSHHVAHIDSQTISYS